MRQSTWSDEELHIDQQNKKWPSWAPINRLEDMTLFIQKHCMEPGYETYVVDMEIFRAGMGLEAEWMARHAGWAAVRRIPVDKHLPPIYRRLLAAQRGELTVEDVLLKNEMSDCLTDFQLLSASDMMDMKDRDKQFRKAFKPPPDWWKMLRPGASDAPGLLARKVQHVDYVHALQYARTHPVWKHVDRFSIPTLDSLLFLQDLKPSALGGPVRTLLKLLEDAAEILKALRLSHEEQLRRLDDIISNDDRELIETYLAAYPNGELNDNERDTRDGFGMAGEGLTEAILSGVPYRV
ncbi:hypothetical protein PENSPDRAFT_694395 [Peniophora sp. CONT]|nr:hypothetical protein PENSPDRAFT_694395 [Peniophora sp. CONT]